MAHGDAVQLGVQYLIGIGETYYLGNLVRSFSYVSDADTTVHKDERGATDSVLTQDPRKMLDVVFDIVGVETAFESPVKDSLVSMKGPDDLYPGGYRVASSSVSASEGYATLTMSLIVEDGMGSTFDNATITKSDDWDISLVASQEETITANGANDVSAVYGDGVLMTETTDWAYVGGVVEIKDKYLETKILDPADVVVITICMNYGPALTLTLTGIA